MNQCTSWFAQILIVLAPALAAAAQPDPNPPSRPPRKAVTHTAFYSTQVPTLDGTQRKLAMFRGCVCLVVTPPLRSRDEEAARTTFRRLAELQERHGERGFQVLIFPGEADVESAPAQSADVETWRDHFAAGLPVFGSIHTSGPKTHPLMKVLGAGAPKPHDATRATTRAWLVDRRGWTVARLKFGDLGVSLKALDRRIQAALETVMHPGRFTDEAAGALEAALRTARIRNRNVMVSFLRRGQRESDAFAGFLDSLPMIRLTTEHYVPVRMVLPDVENAEHWLERCAEGRKVTTPFTVWMSPLGRILDSSFDGRRSIGLPKSRADIRRFVSALRRNAPGWGGAAGQHDKVTAALKKAGH